MSDFDFKAHFKNIGIARKAIVDTGLYSGEISCPICKTGMLRFSKAKSNGHIHAQCVTDNKRTDGCVGWME